MIISPRSSHAFGMDMIGHDVVIVREGIEADAALSVLLGNFPIEQLPHLRVRAKLAVSPRVMWIVDTLHAKLRPCSRFRDRLPAAAGKGAMNWAILITTEFHCDLL
jgi:hypothetical protein